MNPDLIKEYKSLDALLLLPSRRYFTDVKVTPGQTNNTTGTGALQHPGTTSTSSTLTGTNEGVGGNFALLKGALARARELNRSPDKFLRISRDPHVSVSSPASAAAAAASPSRFHSRGGGGGGGGGVTLSPHTVAGSTSITPTDADMVLSIFLHLCDDLARQSGKSEPYPPSHTLFSEDLAGVLQLSYHATAALRSGSGVAGGVAGPLVGVVRQTGERGR